MLDSIYASRFFVASLVLGFSVDMKFFILFTVYIWVIFSPSANQIRRYKMMSRPGREVSMHFILLNPWG